MSQDGPQDLGEAPQDLREALQQLRDVVAGDGYDLDWALNARNEVAVKVLPGPDACADCLVPQPVMATILTDALRSTPYTLESIELPSATSH
jgi:hypothetical protein